MNGCLFFISLESMVFAASSYKIMQKHASVILTKTVLIAGINRRSISVPKFGSEKVVTEVIVGTAQASYLKIKMMKQIIQKIIPRKRTNAASFFTHVLFIISQKKNALLQTYNVYSFSLFFKIKINLVLKKYKLFPH